VSALLDALNRAVLRVPLSRSPRDDTNTKKNGAIKNIDLSASDVRGSQRHFAVALTPSSCAVRACFAKRFALNQ
jgi:hypothetical protein